MANAKARFHKFAIMLINLKLPKTILWVINLFLMLFLLFTAFRLITLFAFKPDSMLYADCIRALLIGVRYDFRWISLILLPLTLMSIYRPFSPYFSIKNKKLWTNYLAVIIFLLLFFFIADIISFSYNRTRLDAGAMNFVEDPAISIKMMWQTYPLIWILLGLACALLAFKWLLNKSHLRIINHTDGKAIQHRKLPFYFTTLILLIFIYGSFSLRPLKWKDAFALKDSFKTYLALNPLQNFFSTMQFREPVYNEGAARAAFPLMANFLQLPEKDNFSFKRIIQPRANALTSKPNIVLVMCESFSMYKSTMSGNPLNATPYFDSLTKQGIFFERCFSPHFSTARGLFAIITGTPDVQLFKFSTRNPEAIDQYTIINEFADYNKHYFLGGNPEFNNFEGLLKNIDGLQVHADEHFKAPKVNVWGISDKDLFLSANDVFKKEQKPFFAIVQTSDNHRPYTIPETDKDFAIAELPKEQLLRYGFESVNEFNAFRYSDYCFRRFIDAAKKEPYFNNTIFVFIGDHGVAGNATAIYPPAWTNQRLSDEHVPLLFYAPSLIKPRLHKEVVSQIDVMPTIAGLVHQPYTNTTLGRDLLNAAKKNDLAFITNTAGKIGVVTNQFYFIKNLDFTEKEMVPVVETTEAYTTAQLDSIQHKLESLTDAFYQSARYLLMNNKQ